MFRIKVSMLASGIRALRRDWRSGELRLLASALVIAVSAVTSVGFLADRVAAALERDAAQMLGADLVVRASQPLLQELHQHAWDTGLETAVTVQFPSMVSYGDATLLAALKAVSPNYPLRGRVRVSEAPGAPDGPAHDAPQAGTVWADHQLLVMLGLSVGDSVEVGQSQLKIAKIITYEPDRGLQFVNVAPRVMLAVADLPATGLVGPGSRVSHRLMAAGPQSAVEAYRNWIEPRLEAGQRLSTLESNRPELQQAMSRADQFLTLVALLTVMIAAVAVALASRRFALRHRDGIAVMRCLGASRVQLGASLWAEFFALGVLASVVGTALGYVAHQGLVVLASAVFDAVLPRASWNPAGLGMATGLLLLLGFAIPPLARLPMVPPARVLRREAGAPAVRHWVAYLVGLTAFFLLIVWMSGDIRLSSLISGGFLIAFALFAGVGALLVTLAGRGRDIFNGFPALRFALAGLSQRRALTVTQLCALTMGLMILLLLAITRTDLLKGWQETVPPDAPNTFLINIQADQHDAVIERLTGAGLTATNMSPMVRGRLLAINQQPVSADDYEDERARNMVQREFNLSSATLLPDSNTVTRGRWLDPGEAEASLEDGLAKTLGVGVGDMLSFDIAGQAVEVLVSGLREVKWDSFQVNFFALLSPQVLQHAPTTYITSFHLPSSNKPFVQQLVSEFPNLTVFDVDAILGQVQHVLDQVIQAVQLLFLFTLAAGILVLGAALFSTRDERMHEVAILRALGASGRQLRVALRIELVLLGSLAGLMAAVGAQGVAMALASQVFDFSLGLSLWPVAAGVGAGIAAALAGGGLALRGVLNAPPLVSLRENG